MFRRTFQGVLTVSIILCLSIAAEAQSSSKPKDDERPVFPLLKAHDWSAKKLCVVQNYEEVDRAPMPLIAFCHNLKDNFALITKQAATKNGWTAKSLREQAQKNIDAYPARWERFQGFMLTASGKDFSSEKLLCKEFLKEAQKMLGAKKILVAAPRRTVLYAASNELKDESLDLFKMIVSKTLADDSFGHQKISPLIFRFEDGELVGALIVKEVEK